MSRVERVVSLLRQIENETRVAFDEHTQLYHRTQSLESENAKLREENKELRMVAVRYYTELLHSDDVLGQIMARKKLQELGIELSK